MQDEAKDPRGGICAGLGAPLAVDLDTAGEMLGGVSAATVKREIYRGHLHGLKVGRQWRVRVAELHAYLKRQETTA